MSRNTIINSQEHLGQLRSIGYFNISHQREELGATHVPKNFGFRQRKIIEARHSSYARVSFYLNPNRRRSRYKDGQKLTILYSDANQSLKKTCLEHSLLKVEASLSGFRQPRWASGAINAGA
jgi:hypothetical protein